MPNDHALLIIDAQELFLAPPHAHEEWRVAKGAISPPRPEDCQKIEDRLANIAAVTEAVRPHADIMWAVMMPHMPARVTMRTAEYQKWVADGLFGELELRHLKPQDGDLIFSKNEASVFSNRMLAPLLKGYKTFDMCGFNVLECVAASCMDAQAMQKTGKLDAGLAARMVLDLSANGFRLAQGFRPIPDDSHVEAYYQSYRLPVTRAETLLDEIGVALPERPGAPRGAFAPPALEI